MENIASFIEANPALKEEITRQAADGKTTFTVDDLKAIASQVGIDAASLEDMKGSLKNGKLSDADLAGVTGGGKISVGIGGFVINIKTPW